MLEEAIKLIKRESQRIQELFKEEFFHLEESFALVKKELIVKQNEIDRQ